MSREKSEPIVDPTKRFEQLDELISAEKNITGFRGYDRNTGNEITWYEANFKWVPSEQYSTIMAYIQQLQTLRNDSLVSLIGYWLDEEKDKLYLITESTYTNSIRTQIRHLKVRLSAISNWFRPVLGALAFLHAQNPPVIHSHVSLNTIFVKGSSGHVRLISPLFDPSSISVQTNEINIKYSTPPESLLDNPTAASDIWMFGITLLEAITRQTPYSECESTVKLIEKISHYVQPDSLKCVKNDHARNLIASCLVPPEQRPAAKDLYNHPFFSQNFDQDAIPPPEKNAEYEVLFSAKLRSSSNRDIPKVEDDLLRSTSAPQFTQMPSTQTSGTTLGVITE